MSKSQNKKPRELLDAQVAAIRAVKIYLGTIALVRHAAKAGDEHAKEMLEIFGQLDRVVFCDRQIAQLSQDDWDANPGRSKPYKKLIRKWNLVTNVAEDMASVIAEGYAVRTGAELLAPADLDPASVAS